MSDTIFSILESISKEENIPPKVYSKTILSNKVKDKLLSYQENHVIKIINSLLKSNIALDSSDTGTGKTYMASAICCELNRRPIVVCPKTLIFNWISVLSFFGIKHYDVVNYETIKNGKTYTNKNYKSRKRSPFIKINESNCDEPLRHRYKWSIPEDAILIFDEAHRCKDPTTENGKLLISSKQLIDQKIPVLIMSATICEEFIDMKIPFYLFNFIPNTRNFGHYIRSIRKKYPQHKINMNDAKSMRDATQSLIIYEEIKEFTSRIRIKDLGNRFPSNQCIAQQFVADDIDEISKAYKKIASLSKNLGKDYSEHILAEIQKLKQKIELRKIPIFIEQAQLHLEEGKSVIIFVNYLNTLHILSKELNIKCCIYGSSKKGKKQTMEERQNAIDLFQSNRERIIISQMRAGSVGIGLHDLHGNHPRIVLINYPDSASDLLQALGRAPRAGAKTPVLQRIIFVANVEYEKRIAENINKKLLNISAINDGDLNSYDYQVKEV